MKQLARWSFYCLILIVLAAPVFVSAAGDADAGKATYDKKCATCHGKDGEAKAAMAKMFKVEMKHLGSKDVQSLTDETMAKLINEGQGKMKPVKGLNEAEVANVIAYVRTLKQ